MTELARALETARAKRKLLVPYVMGGIPDAGAFPSVLDALTPFADAIEVGLPFSDPLMDGPVIAAAGERAIEEGTGPLDALELSSKNIGHRVAMTYYNPIHRLGESAFCSRAASCGFAGLIVPDLPLEESESLRAACAEEGLAWIPLVAPTSPPDRVARIVETATGFVYAVSTLGVTGTRDSLSDRAAAVVEKVRAATDAPVLVGIGVSTPDQARTAAEVADGVVIGSAVVRRVVDEGTEAAAAFLADVRNALDG
ncbi:MAG: tryptophan synthase subunit alpha [Actinomycetota bacterium]